MMTEKEGSIEKIYRRSSEWLRNNWQDALLVAVGFALLEGTNTTNLWEDDPFRKAMAGPDGTDFFDKPFIDFHPEGKFSLVPEINPWWWDEPTS
jgi:hypothetical protein